MDKQKKNDLYDIEYNEEIKDMDEFLINYYDGYKYEDLNNEEQINIKGPTSQNRRLSIKFKLDAIKRSELIGNRAAAKELKVSERSIRYWRCNKSNYQNISNKTNKITIHKGKQSIEDIDWDKISKYKNRKKGILVTTENIFQRILIIYSGSNFNMRKHALYQRIYRFIKRSNYSIRRGSNIGQMLPDNAFDLITDFLNEIYKKRKISYNKELDLDCIVNLDETAITLNMPPKNTIQNKGDKTVMIKTYGQDKERVSIILAVSALGSKLPPLLIFKRKKGGSIEKK